MSNNSDIDYMDDHHDDNIEATIIMIMKKSWKKFSSMVKTIENYQKSLFYMMQIFNNFSILPKKKNPHKLYICMI